MRVDGQFVKLFVKRLSPFAGLPMLKAGLCCGTSTCGDCFFYFLTFPNARHF